MLFEVINIYKLANNYYMWMRFNIIAKKQRKINNR